MIRRNRLLNIVLYLTGLKFKMQIFGIDAKRFLEMDFFTNVLTSSALISLAKTSIAMTYIYFPILRESSPIKIFLSDNIALLDAVINKFLSIQSRGVYLDKSEPYCYLIITSR